MGGCGWHLMLREEHFWNLISLLNFDPALLGTVPFSNYNKTKEARCLGWFEEKFVASNVEAWLHPETTLCLCDEMWLEGLGNSLLHWRRPYNFFECNWRREDLSRGWWWKTSGKVVEVTCCLSVKVHIWESVFYCSARMAHGVDKALLVFIVLARFLPPVTDLKYVVQSHVFLRNLVL